jgi:hypothetical protein
MLLAVGVEVVRVGRTLLSDAFDFAFDLDPAIDFDLA